MEVMVPADGVPIFMSIRPTRIIPDSVRDMNDGSGKKSKNFPQELSVLPNCKPADPAVHRLADAHSRCWRPTCCARAGKKALATNSENRQPVRVPNDTNRAHWVIPSCK